MAVGLDNAYILGVTSMDDQHGKLVEIGNRLLELIELGESVDHYDEIMKVLEELRDYTIYHFETEEALFSELDYPNKDVHIMEHQFFIKKIDKFFDTDIDEHQLDSLKKLTDFVMGWVLHHILNTDNEYAEILNEG